MEILELNYNVETKEETVNKRALTTDEQITIERHNLNNELLRLIQWFEEYDNQVKQYQRCQRLGIEYDRDIVELDNQAKVNAERITEIRNLLKK